MASHKKITNLTRGCELKRSQAISRIEAGLSEWVRIGVSIRDLSRDERLLRFASESHRRQSIPEYLPPIEPNGCKFVPPESSHTSLREIWDLVRQARQFCAEVG